MLRAVAEGHRNEAGGRRRPEGRRTSEAPGSSSLQLAGTLAPGPQSAAGGAAVAPFPEAPLHASWLGSATCAAAWLAAPATAKRAASCEVGCTRSAGGGAPPLPPAPPGGSSQTTAWRDPGSSTISSTIRCTWVHEESKGKSRPCHRNPCWAKPRAAATVIQGEQVPRTSAPELAAVTDTCSPSAGSRSGDPKEKRLTVAGASIMPVSRRQPPPSHAAQSLRRADRALAAAGGKMRSSGSSDCRLRLYQGASDRILPCRSHGVGQVGRQQRGAEMSRARAARR